MKSLLDTQSSSHILQGQTYSCWSWVVALKRPSGSSVNWLFWRYLENEEIKQECEAMHHTIMFTKTRLASRGRTVSKHRAPTAVQSKTLPTSMCTWSHHSVSWGDSHIPDTFSLMYDRTTVLRSLVPRFSYYLQNTRYQLLSVLYTDIVNITHTKLFTHSAMTDLQILEVCGSIKKTLWQHCQLVVVEIPGEWETKQECEAVHHTIMFTKTRLAIRGRTVSLLTKHTQGTNCCAEHLDTIK